MADDEEVSQPPSVPSMADAASAPATGAAAGAPALDPDLEKLVADALAAGEWKEERSSTSSGGVKVWYWCKRDKKLKMKNRAALGEYLKAQKDSKSPGLGPASSAADGSAAKLPTAAADGKQSSDVAGTAGHRSNPDMAKLASMGVLGANVDEMSDLAELRNQIRLWEAKYKVLLDENKRLLIGSGILAPPVAGVTVPSDLQLKYDALLRQNSALQAELEVKGLECERLSTTVQDLADHKAKLEVQLGEAFQKAAEGMDYKLKLQQKDDIVQKASGFVNDHFREQNKFLSAQVAELTALLNKIKEEDRVAARAVSADAPLLTTDALTPSERAKVAVHFDAIVNTPARHVLCGRCRATISRMVTSEATGPHSPHAIMAADVHPHADSVPTPLPRPAYIHKAVPVGHAVPLQVIQARPTAAPPQPAAVAQFEGYIVRARQ